MNTEEQLKFCGICKHQKQNENQNLFCGLTNSPASFENSCPDFSENTEHANVPDEGISEFELELRLAGKGKRLANYLLDILFYMIFSFSLRLGLVIFMLFIDKNIANTLIYHAKIWDYLWGFLHGMFYYTLFEATTGRTLAKFITRTKVVTEKGEKPGFMAIFKRSLCRFIPFETFTFLMSEDLGLHDRLSNTLVINTMSVPVLTNEISASDQINTKPV